MEINFNLDIDDYMAFQKFHLSNSSKIKKNRIVSILAIPISLALILFFLKDTIALDSVMIISFVTCSIIIMIYISKNYLNSILKKTRKTLESGDNSSLFGERKITFSDEGISVITLNSNGKTSWEGLKEILENDNYYFLYTSSVSAFIIPKRKIEQNLLELEQFLKQKKIYLDTNNS